ncbi:competence protein TfoX [Vallitalea longa]|uniref:Competence protein TfoX n=1 Tax=Vallitalea longa TaxID=2936439 RepID=A0A9W5YCM2_9FIRM|nr:TfoX/Sxy family DNA transformation protein [Vallitalea longa]GKX30101.1 competence protein TfoX [Vallitalea longa]
MKLSELPNIGKTLEKELNDIGIQTAEDLKETGSIEAIIRLNVHGDTCCNKLYALEGAIREVRWHHLPKDVRLQLKSEYDKLKK